MAYDIHVTTVRRYVSRVHAVRTAKQGTRPLSRQEKANAYESAFNLAKRLDQPVPSTPEEMEALLALL